MTSPRVLQHRDHTIYDIVGDRYTMLATGADTRGQYALWDALVPPGGGPPPHLHTNEDERFTVLQGAVTFFLGPQRIVATPGMSVSAPRGHAHAFRNETDAPARMLIHVQPAGFEKFLEAAAVRITDPGSPVTPPTPEHIDRVLRLAPMYGIRFVQPD